MNNVISIEEINNNIDYYAREFSEGNPNLENLLKEMWARNFETVGCCTGHDNDESAKPYIAFKVNDKNKTLNLISSINKNNIRIGFTTNKGEINCGITSRNRQDIFNDIIKSLDKTNTNMYLKEVLDKVFDLNRVNFNNLIIYYDDNGNIEGIRLNTDDNNTIEKLIKDNYSYQPLNKNIYHFIIK